jgi:hypothetical protein
LSNTSTHVFRPFSSEINFDFIRGTEPNGPRTS